MTGLTVSKFVFPSSSYEGALNAGMVNSIFVAAISMVVVTSNTELLKKFSFPVDRNMLVLSHILLTLVLPFILLLTSCTFFLVDFLVAKWIFAAFPGSFYVWGFTKSSFLLGFIMAYIFIVCLTAVTWAVFAWFYRYKITVGVIGGMFFLAVICLDDFRDACFKLASSLFDPAPGLFFLKFVVITLIAFALGYIPIKRMEVKK